jgi:hypothetical protein
MHAIFDIGSAVEKAPPQVANGHFQNPRYKAVLNPQGFGAPPKE